jgi:WhiB family transcriptional regulator, redox-sensing transcriptional regulator
VSAVLPTLDSLHELIVRVRPAWHADALCREHPEVNFFPERGEDARPARAICARCPVIAECRSHAVERNEIHGLWGGTSVRERRKLRTTARTPQERRAA